MRLSFFINLHEIKYDQIRPIIGPLFSKFLPKEDDRIEIKLKEGHIKFWFEKRGFHDESGYIRYDFNKNEIDEKVIPNQGIIEGGHLFGEIQLPGKFPKVGSPSDEIGNQKILKSTKDIIKIISEEVQLIIDQLRFNFGHYWIREFEEWDSRAHSLGYYCKNILHLKLYDEKTNDWLIVEPNKSESTIQLAVLLRSSFPDYMTKENWNLFKKLAIEKHKPSQAQKYLISAFIALDSDDLSRAFIDAVTTLEMAIDLYYRRINDKSEKFGKPISKIKGLGNREQLLIIFGSNLSMVSADLEAAIEAVEIRNRIVHEGYLPQIPDKPKLKSLLKLNAIVINEPASFFLPRNTGNSLAPPK